ncbi:hypothetical protein AYI70_g2298 [Smittium culicis]|uniref:Uncharacterized protein n=1 Tax=Smittium culicis TaxID=133412 RepID=A0A1R1Y8V8_9FUNG|nr:hypothetical protein AYI70_g9296 [Smittium culicis]OMJ23372.1 hypothetical protein AYI70_g2298 [Smittium culicis]
MMIFSKQDFKPPPPPTQKNIQDADAIPKTVAIQLLLAKIHTGCFQLVLYPFFSFITTSLSISFTLHVF